MKQRILLSKRRRGLFMLLIFAVCSLSSLAQQPPSEIGNWLMYFGQNRISEKLSVHTEFQYRNHTALPVNVEQLMIRTGLNYHLNENAFVTAGYAYIPSYVYDSEQSAPEQEEHRIWQQLIMNNYLGRVKFEHRYRVEQRWVDDDYRNRFRYRLMAFIPLNKKQMGPKAIFIGLYDEIFVNGEQVFFDRNRAYAALGYQINAATQVQAGLLHQQQSNFGKRYLQFTLVYNPDFRRD
ncbi:DUF2490 domain-containing protein [Halocola ammonii]